MPDITDFLKLLLDANVPKKAALALTKLKALEPSEWKGNKDGEKEHFKNPTFSCGADLSTKRAWMAFEYADNDGDHALRCTCPLQEIGKRGGDDVIEIDGVEMDDDDFVMSSRSGFGPVTNEDGSEGPESGFYNRVVLEFKFTQDGVARRYRFDGDMG